MNGVGEGEGEDEGRVGKSGLDYLYLIYAEVV